MNRITKVAIETIRDCNGKCRICNYKDTGRPKIPKRMGPKVFRAIVEQIKGLPNLKTVCPYNHDEALLDPSIWGRIRYIKAHLPHVKIELSTNGLLLSEENTGQFLYLVDDKWISFHSINKATYEQMMGLPWEHGERMKRLIKDNPQCQFSIQTAIVPEYTEEQVKDFWSDCDNVKLQTFIPHDRCGNIKSDWCASFDNPPRPDFDCWRLNMFLVYATDGSLIPCSNDLEERHKVGTYFMDLNEVMGQREDFRVLNRIGAKTICWRCQDST